MLPWKKLTNLDSNFQNLLLISALLLKDNDLTKSYNKSSKHYEDYKSMKDGTEKARVSYASGIRDVATKDVIRTAEDAEKYISNNMKRASFSSHGQLEGFEFRLKSEDSLNRKFRDFECSLGKGTYSARALLQACGETHDILRYTVIYDNKNFVKNFMMFMKYMKNKNIRFVRIKNTFNAKDTYKGVNTFMRATLEDGLDYVFEVQFHTRQSFDAKMDTHEYYEVERDSTSTEAQVEEARIAQANIFKAVNAPENYELIKEMNNLENELVGLVAA